MGALLTLTFVVEVMLAFDEFEEKMFTTVLPRLRRPSAPRPEAAV
jgi:hypothetical protein